MDEKEQLRQRIRELASAWLMALAAATVAVMHFRLVFLKNNSLKIKWLWTMAAIALLGGMLLAGLHGGRFLAPVSWLDIPMMRALHGSLNAVGFGLCGVWGWWMDAKTNQKGAGNRFDFQKVMGNYHDFSVCLTSALGKNKLLI